MNGFDATRLGRELAKLEDEDPAVKEAADRLREALSPHHRWLHAMVREVWADDTEPLTCDFCRSTDDVAATGRQGMRGCAECRERL